MRERESGSGFLKMKPQGDLKALLVRLVGLPKLKEVTALAHLKNAADNPMIDGVGFDRMRQRVWWALRDCYLPKMDSETLREDPLGDNENLAAYLEKVEIGNRARHRV
ncbi:hypothetical protein chiPu_0005848 [Chiloscyllium punctatum]|uniref:Uncharacterized protein n=1 Tax=Chiloscyllium punctatum TaxID=137246 RepID=A0A401SAQ2_CHIPU|nr:hypothetical protein [Chiloscyllium punctatum]